MILHTYFTDGRFGWACLFLSSFKKYHGTNILVHACTRDLPLKNQRTIKNIYPNIVIDNKEIDYNYVADRAGVPIKTIKLWKSQIEHGSPTKGKSDIWKKYISVEDRYRDTIVEALNLYPTETILHCDIDTYFRGNLQPLFNLIESNDISIRFRLNDPNIGRKVLACMIGIKKKDVVMDFIFSWISKMDAVSLVDKTRSERFSQVVFYRTYLEFVDRLKWGNIPAKYSDPVRGKTYPIWTGCKKAKDVGLTECISDFKSRE